MKKILGILLLLVVVGIATPKAYAISLDDLFAEITSLKAQVSELKVQLSAAVLNATKSNTTISNTVSTQEKTQPVVIGTDSKTSPPSSMQTSQTAVFTSTSATYGLGTTTATASLSAPTQIVPSEVSIPTVSAPAITLALARGSDNIQVTTLQQVLASLGFFSGEYTTFFGAKTEAALKAFQSANGLEAVGSVGPKTRGILNEKSGGASISSANGQSNVTRNEKVFLMGGTDSDLGVNNVVSSSDGINWTQVTAHAGWSGRIGHSSVYFNNKIWVLGGHSRNVQGENGVSTNSVYYNDVWSSSDGANWTQVSAHAPWGERSFSGVVIFNNKIWVIGGYSFNNSAYDANPNDPASYITVYHDVWSSSDGINWTQSVSNLPFDISVGYPRSSTVFNNKIWALSSPYSLNGLPSTRGVWSSADGANWDMVSSTLPEITNGIRQDSRNGYSVISFNNKLWILGGGSELGHSIYDAVWSSVDGVNWVNNVAWPANSALWYKAGHSAASFNKKMWVFGNYPNDDWYSVDGINWIQGTSNIPNLARNYHSVVVVPSTFGQTTTQPPLTNCTLTSTPLTTPATQNISTGTNNYLFAQFKVTANGCNVNLNTFKISVGGTVAPNQVNSLNNLVIRDQNGVQLGVTIPTVSNQTQYSTTYNYALQNGVTKVIKLYADVPSGTGLNAKLGLSGLIGTNAQTGATVSYNGLIGVSSYWGQLMNIVQ